MLDLLVIDHDLKMTIFSISVGSFALVSNLTECDERDFAKLNLLTGRWPIRPVAGFLAMLTNNN
jgi:hypothetical protein